MNARDSFLVNYPGMQGAPTISAINYSPQNFALGDTVWITADITSASNVLLASRFGIGELYNKSLMHDDGMHNDGGANDGVYGGLITNACNNIQYYIYAENDSSGMFSPQRAAYEYHSIQNQLNLGDIVINEIMAKNESVVADQSGDYDDWIELYNLSASNVSTSGLFLSDDSTNLLKWPIPEKTIPSDDYLIIWADNDSDQEGLHANFKLSSSGENLFLSYDSLSILDAVSFSTQNPDMAFARIPNGTGPFVESIPSYNANNDYAQTTTLNQVDFKCFPNPVKNKLNIRHNLNTKGTFTLLNIEGQTLQIENVFSNENTLEINLKELKSGIYFINLSAKSVSVTKKIIKL